MIPITQSVFYPEDSNFYPGYTYTAMTTVKKGECLTQIPKPKKERPAWKSHWPEAKRQK